MPPVEIDVRKYLMVFAAALLVLLANAWIAASCSAPPPNVLPKPVRELVVAHETLTVRDQAAIDAAKARAAAADRRAAADRALAAAAGRRADSLAAIATAQGDTSTQWKAAYEERSEQVQHLESVVADKEVRAREDSIALAKSESARARGEDALRRVQEAIPTLQPRFRDRLKEALRPEVVGGYGVVATRDGEVHHGPALTVGWKIPVF